MFKGNVSYFNLAIANNLVLPRAFLFLLLPLLVLLSLWISQTALIATALIFILYLITMVLALPSELVNKELMTAVWKIPKAIFLMLGTLFRIRQSNKTFIHTVHTKTEISNPLFKEQAE